MAVIVVIKDCSECHCVWFNRPEQIHKCSWGEVPMDLPKFPVIPEECPLKK